MRHKFVRFGYRNGEILIVERIAFFGNPLSALGKPAVDGRRLGFLILILLQGEEFEKVLHRRRAKHAVCILFNFQKFRNFLVALVPNLPDDLLQNILHGDNAGGFAVFVDDKHQVIMIRLHILKQQIQIQRFRHNDRLMQNGCQRKAGLFMRKKIVARVQDSDDVILLGVIHGNAGICLVFNHGEHLCLACILLEANDRLPGRHHILRAHAVQLEHILDIFNIILIERAVARARIQHQNDVLLGNRFLLFMRVNADQAQNAVGRHR